jgi:hypothetical protein
MDIGHQQKVIFLRLNNQGDNVILKNHEIESFKQIPDHIALRSFYDCM